MQQQSKLLGGVLLVSGTTIGAAMLALPVSTGISGFIPSIAVFLFCWLYLTASAFLLLEVNLWMEPNTNLITMAKKTLGRTGQIVSWVAYLYLLYALTTAYMAGSATIIIGLVHYLTGHSPPKILGALPLILIFGYFVYRGTKFVDYVNRILMVGMATSFMIIIVFLTDNVDMALLQHADWEYIPLALSVVVTSFGFHVIIPTLNTYLNHDIPLLVKTLIIGSIVPLIVYVLWQFIMLGIIPEFDLITGYIQGSNAVNLAAVVLGESWLAIVARFLGFFVIITSFLGVSISLLDCLADGFKIQKTRKGRALLYAMTFFPPLFITLSNPRAFLSALEYAGAFGVATLLGLMPALMAWSGRYYKKYPSNFRVPGGKMVLLFVIASSAIIIGIEIAFKLGYTESVRGLINQGG